MSCDSCTSYEVKCYCLESIGKHRHICMQCAEAFECEAPEDGTGPVCRMFDVHVCQDCYQEMEEDFEYFKTQI